MIVGKCIRILAHLVVCRTAPADAFYGPAILVGVGTKGEATSIVTRPTVVVVVIGNRLTEDVVAGIAEVIRSLVHHSD